MNADELLDRKRLEEILASPEQRANYEKIFANAGDGVRLKDLDNLVQGTKLWRPVEIVDLKVGEILQRTQNLANRLETTPTGHFFAEPGSSEHELGMRDIERAASPDSQVGEQPPKEYDRDYYIVTKPVAAIKGVAADVARPSESFNSAGRLYEGGATQYFVLEVGALERVVANRPAPETPSPEPKPTPAVADPPTVPASSSEPDSPLRERLRQAEERWKQSQQEDQEKSQTFTQQRQHRR